ncbi:MULTISPECIES: glycosyltransferase [unclassified Bacillus (in: firmicutes)]|uniref:teichuronic acid biosynthesis protein TuaC n=1 Tax=unclassified Bacillus (in: firmicutes) TaxID=185979 RepID=UPI001BECC878|nr:MULTISPECIES: glycosyltransferase [unclassified Bacillus (in: firmicutes)]MBT2725209.1 glycosyltransferase [Bacillus sp. ISL-46]MBT2744435.1 glycosyltransferase [Bacillus sp. ISL-77]
MKILWITSAYPSVEKPGLGVFHETQVQALIRLGVEVTVICPVPRNPFLIRYVKKQYRAYKEIPFVYLRKGVTVYRPPYLALPGQLRWAQPDKRMAACILKTMSDYEIEPDLMHAHFAMPSGGAARIVAEQKKLPWILTLHGSDVNIYPNYSASAKKAFEQTVQAANQVLAVGESLKIRTKELAGRDSMVLPIGVDLSQFKPPEETKREIRRRLQLPEEKKIVVFVGRLTQAKGVFELAHSLHWLSNDVAILFVGDGPAKDKLQQHSDFNRRLFLTGQVENESVKDYLFASDVFALPSYTEGMPTVVIEALALKVPVICTAVGSVPELFGEHRQLLIESKSVSSLVNRINGILNRNLYPTQVQHELYEHIQKNYHADHNGALLNDVYTRTIESIYLTE